MRPLGLMALGAAILSLALSVTYFLSPHALVVAIVALLLGGVSHTHPVTRGTGSVAMVLAVLAIAVSSAMLMWI
jgi:hypothetical protein